MDGIWIPIIAIACAPVIAIGVPIARAWARRIEAQGQQPRMPSVPSVPSDLGARLERMEQAIDAIAVEIERVSEAQRFTTRLLAESGAGAARAVLPQDVGARVPEGVDAH
jgi:hypothetical protein